MSRLLFAVTAPVALFVACSDATGPRNECNTVALPLSGTASAPTVVAVGLEVQASGIVVVAMVTDPQGTDNLLDVMQSISVFPDRQCAGAPIVLQDDLAGSGVEETFGTAVDAMANPALYNAIAAAVTWPVEVDFRDQDGNRTTGRVMASVVD
jgi:hypothetical protein